MTTSLDVHLESDGRVTLIGELDISTVPCLEGALTGHGDGGPLVLELAHLTFLDSTGLRAIIRLARSRQALGPVVLRGPTAPVLEVLEISGVIGGARNLGVERGRGPISV